MSVSQTISKLRKERGMTQDQLAARLYVTRQAVSRWENGESEPGIDMRKLLAGVLDVPVIQLLDLPDEPVCQCCGTPFSVPNMPYGTDSEGVENTNYCKWCYENGEFTGSALDDIIERNVPFLCAATGYTPEEAVSFMGIVLPSLKRWSSVKNENKSSNVAKSKFYTCPSCGNVIWSMGEVACTCCGKPLESLVATKPDEMHEAMIEVSDGCQVVSIDHPMNKEHHIRFIACVVDDSIRIKWLYPEQEAIASFYIQGPGKLYAYCNKDGLFRIG
ncbi:MAG: helix-turn-helix domain-containing protein [Eggerthellaceae bacterium]|nr:helix-turn-helix domain-containing protein [Eggerthellaceae bacterium]